MITLKLEFINVGLCHEEDDFIVEKLRWVVILSDGKIVYQDDNRPGEIIPKAWDRLRKHIYDNNLSITNFKIQFCDHIEEAAPPNAKGYYYVQKVMAYAFSGVAESTIRYYLIGAVMDSQIDVIEWMVPEIIITGHEIRPIIENDPCLIMNPRDI